MRPLPGEYTGTSVCSDGSHQYHDVLADFEGFFPHLLPRAIVAFHDVEEAWPGPLRIWHEIAKHRLTEIGYCDSLAYGLKEAE